MRYYLLIVGLALTGFGLRLAYQCVNFLLHSRKTYGRFDNWKEVPKLNSSEVYYYVDVVFQASDGTEYHVTGNTGSGSSRGRKPEQTPAIPVRYDPDSPDDAQIATLFNLWSAPLAFILLGGAAIFGFFQARHWADTIRAKLPRSLSSLCLAPPCHHF